MIIFTSFNESRNILKKDFIRHRDVNLCSVSRWQPKGFSYIDLPFLAAKNVNGEKLTLKNGLKEYKRQLYMYYKSQWKDSIVPWVESLNPDVVYMLCCWCPHASHSRRQLDVYNTFVCHNALIGDVISLVRDDISIFLDDVRHRKLDDYFKPSIKYNVI